MWMRAGRYPSRVWAALKGREEMMSAKDAKDAKAPLVRGGLAS